jgi:zona occludens toxin
MISLLVGPSGAGKSYEATVFHALPALRAGRQVWTNLPIVHEKFRRLEPAAVHLLKTIGDHKDDVSGVRTRAFATLRDYPTENVTSDVGPLIIIDECHKALPFRGTGQPVEEWFAEHRHARCDVLLITQSYGKISAAIRDNVQTVYKVRKGTAFGFAQKYVRKVQDGLRGDIVNTTVRTYDRKYFGLYRSHTKGTEGLEAGATDIVPIWRRWPVIGAAIVFPLGLFWMLSLGSPFAAAKPKNLDAVQADAKKVLAPSVAPVDAVIKATADVVSGKKSELKPEATEAMDPYGSKGLHYQGKIGFGRKVVHLFGVSQGSALIGSVTSEELELAGYKVKIVGECTGWIYYGKTERPVVCDSGAMVVGGVPSVRTRSAVEGTPEGGGAAAQSVKTQKPISSPVRS